MLEPESDGVVDRLVVGPGRSPDEHPRAGVDLRDQFEPEPKRAAAAGRLQPGDAVVRGMMAEQDRAKQLGEPFVARAAEIGLGHLRGVEAPLGFLHDLEDRRIARAVAEHADADIDLVRPGIGIDQGDQPDQRILGHGLEVGKASGLRVGLRQHAGADSRELPSLKREGLGVGAGERAQCP